MLTFLFFLKSRARFLRLFFWLRVKFASDHDMVLRSIVSVSNDACRGVLD